MHSLALNKILQTVKYLALLNEGSFKRILVVMLLIFWLGLSSHQHCKGYMVILIFTGAGKSQLPLHALFQAPPE